MVTRKMHSPSLRYRNFPLAHSTSEDEQTPVGSPASMEQKQDIQSEASAMMDSVVLDPDKLPSWQRAFILRPNVRFTRTPGGIFSNSHRENQSRPEHAARQHAQPSLVAAHAHTPHVSAHQTDPQEEAQVVLPSPTLDTPARTLENRENPESITIQDRTQSITPVMNRTQAQASVVENFVPTVTSDGEQMPAQPPATRRRTTTTIPDHLIWEMMSLGASENIEPSAPRPPAKTAPPPSTLHVTTTSKAISTPAEIAVPSTVTRPGTPDFAGDTDQTALLPSAVHLYRQVALHQSRSTELEPESVPEAAVEAIQPDLSHLSAPSSIENNCQSSRASSADAPDYLFPSVDLLQRAPSNETEAMSQEALEQSAGLLESILEDFGVKGEIIDVCPGPVVTLYEFAPAPGVKSSRVINLSDDIARSMSALSARVAVIPGRNVIGIELPNVERETVYLRELIDSENYVGTDYRLPLCLGKTIGGEPVVAELTKMPHLLVAGTTGSGKSVAINTMILSLIYHLRPEECRLIMVDPKMLELSVYDGIPHLLTPVVTDSKKAVLALKWAVREMEDRYRKMSRLGVRNIDGFNAAVSDARAKGSTITLNVPTGFDRTTGEQLFEEQELDLTALPYIVVIVDEMADLMMVAGKEIEGAIQRLAQMARAAGIHLIMATQRPSVDVITGTIKANFPTRISFQVTSKIDSRTILGEPGAEHLLGQGDMLHMIGGGRISRVHGPFVSDREVEKIVDHLKTQGQPSYLGSVTEDDEEGSDEDNETAVFDTTTMGVDGDAEDLYQNAIRIVLRDKKCSTSYIQRRLSIGYNRAATLVERMEKDGLVGAPNHVGKREILTQRLQEERGMEE